MIRQVKAEDAAQIASIYNHYINETTVTFENEALSYREMKDRINAISTSCPYFVYEENSTIKSVPPTQRLMK